MRIVVRSRFAKLVGPNKKLARMCVYRGDGDRVVVVVVVVAQVHWTVIRSDGIPTDYGPSVGDGCCGKYT